MRHLLAFVRFILTLSILCVMQVSASADTLQAGQTTYSNVFVESLQRDEESGAKIFMVRFEDRSRSPVAADRVTRIVFGDDDEGRIADIQIGTSRFHDTHAGVRLLYLAGGTLTVVTKGTTETKDYALSEVVSFTAEPPEEVEQEVEVEDEPLSIPTDTFDEASEDSGTKWEVTGFEWAVVVVLVGWMLCTHLPLFWYMLVEGQYLWIVFLGMAGWCFPLHLLFLLFFYEGPRKGMFLWFLGVEIILGVVAGAVLQLSA